jgi:hemerythrin-like domain-containing protein
VRLKEGIAFSLLEELNDEFIKRTDRKAYGGERFVRIICKQPVILERTLNQRANQLFNAQQNTKRNDYQKANSSREGRADLDEKRERSRDRYRKNGDQLEKKSSSDSRGRYESKGYPSR